MHSSPRRATSRGATSITAPFKQGFDKLARVLDPSPSPRTSLPEDDAISLKSKSKPGPELYVAMARLYEQSGNAADAEKQYQMALNADPDYLPALLGYAQRKDRDGKSSEAMEFYKRAAKTHPQEASVHNNLGLYFARHNRLDDAVAALRRAIALEPKNPRYRNNIAMVLVDQGKPQEALTHLSEVYSVPVAHYNVGYLLNKKGQTQAAIQQFGQALRADPSLVAARRWMEYLQKTTMQARLPDHPAASGLKMTTGPSKPADAAPLPPHKAPPHRLPPTIPDRSESDASSLPGISYGPSAMPIAPLPPVTSSTLRPLPRVK